ncbi:winged helix-turn-helix domain-containing protein [Serratia fonticola]|uniref:winged helix-turn-helix domain-containing protein n=1 Tax=Serratia fonticola TaxID=47917 RepID=UPI00217C216E|nr:winged helix-turn-helix domain-containing protein [Serratia fonticola]CAI1211413.1 Transcriptional regulatory protein, C terminal [Serratia fonticola]CAI1217788.1 Transcriptional regulatory protein, C terminal [Serratia fonticola]
MSKVYILNTHIEFSPEKSQLSARNSDELVIKLHKPVSRCLELLIERRFSVVPQRDFYPYVWGNEGGSVSVMMLYQCIGLLRKALKAFKTGGNDKMINTVPKMGFSLYPDVTVEEVDELVLAPHEPRAFPASPVAVNKGSALAVTRSSPSIKRAFARPWRGKLLLPAGIIAALGLMVFQLIWWGSPSSENYATKYTHKITVSGCQVFTNHVVNNVDRVKESIEISQINCAEMPYIYLTGFQYSQQLSLLSCDHPLGGNAAPKCYVNNIVRNNKK